uniref:Uncharacterized protein n=1 Tax=Amphimedon queenslandica TaxID=400682 RepID=A0A1X7VN77_AMPQE
MQEHKDREILSEFVNDLFLVVIAGFIFTEAIGRLVDLPEINTNRLLRYSEFINDLFLVVIAGFIFTEAIGRLVDPPEINTNRLLVNYSTK